MLVNLLHSWHGPVTITASGVPVPSQIRQSLLPNPPRLQAKSGPLFAAQLSSFRIVPMPRVFVSSELLLLLNSSR